MRDPKKSSPELRIGSTDEENNVVNTKKHKKQARYGNKWGSHKKPPKRWITECIRKMQNVFERDVSILQDQIHKNLKMKMLRFLIRVIRFLKCGGNIAKFKQPQQSLVF